MRISSMVVAVLLIVAQPLFGQPEAANAAPCQLAGTWYGGSSIEVPYLATFTPSTNGRYTVEFQLVAMPGDVGYKTWTTWKGEAVRVAMDEFEVYAICYALMTPEYAEAGGFDTSAPEFDMLHSHITMTGCDTMTNNIDYFAAHIPFDPAVDTPFVGPFDWELPAGETIHETYQRMPTACCPPADRIPPVRMAPLKKNGAAPAFRWHLR